jgi:molybdate transport system ATP-binding protein
MIEIGILKKIKANHGVLELKVDAAFHTQAITRILGPSGVGKTTLLKVLSGLITPDEGCIKVDGVTWFDSSTSYSMKVQERGVGFVFQDYALFPNMTVEQHLQYGCKDVDYTEHLLDMGEMTNYKKSFPRQLSGGQQQRLAILRALSTRPRLLLMDEPFSAMDLELKIRFIDNLRRLLAEQKTTVILVTHVEHEMSGENTYSVRLTETGMVAV